MNPALKKGNLRHVKKSMSSDQPVRAMQAMQADLVQHLLPFSAC